MTSGPVRVACVGAGYFSQFHYDAWARMPGVEVVGAADLDLEAAGGADDAIEAEIATVSEGIAALDGTLADLSDERASAEEYAEAEQDVIDLEAELAEQEAVQRAALEDAANKEVTDEVELAVQHLLGLDEEEEEPVTETE